MKLSDTLRLQWFRFSSKPCIHIATVHCKHTDWVDIQLHYLRNNLDANYKVWAFLDNVSEKEFVRYKKQFFFCDQSGIEVPDSPGHAEKLNKIAALIMRYAKPSDILIFLDGDAFPIRPMHQFLYEKLEKHRLIAVRRDENGGDTFPHPSFCATTVGFWKELGGDWSVAKSKTAAGRVVADTGGKLYTILQKKNIRWYPLLRTNEHPYHPVYFGIYDDLIYHQSGAFSSRQGTRALLFKKGSSEFNHLKKMGSRIMDNARRNKHFYLDLYCSGKPLSG